MTTSSRKKLPPPSADTAVLSAREFVAALDTRAKRTDGPIAFDIEIAQLAAAWQLDGLAVPDAIHAALDDFAQMWAKAVHQWGGRGNPGPGIMEGHRRAIVGAVHAAVADHERKVAAGDDRSSTDAAEQRVAGVEAELASAQTALAAAVAAGDMDEALRLRGPARIGLPRALAEARLGLLDAYLAERERGREASRARVDRADAGTRGARQAVEDAHLQVAAAVAAAARISEEAREIQAIDRAHLGPIETLRAEREHLVATQAQEHERRQHELAALTS